VKVRLHIERLVLEGVALGPGGAARLLAAMETEFVRLLGSVSLSPALLAGGAIPELHVGALQLERGHSPAQIGTELARIVHGGLAAPEGRYKDSRWKPLRP
jgi:hypothetical protein